MAITLTDLLPNAGSGLGGVGFIFGAGTSVEAGYPMMPTLTRAVIGGLTPTEREYLDEALAASGVTYSDHDGAPNIETVADLVIAHAINSGQSRFSALEERLRLLVTEAILDVTNPTLDHHVRFLTSLKQRAFGQAACVYILTTNYDVLFELAGAQAGVVIETGFIGSVERYFDHQRFTTSCGAMQPQSRFAEHPVLTVRLIKLHGSISWVARDGNLFELHPGAITANQKRVMILPRRRKVMDTLQPPHDTLFSVASRALGAECKYLASCGFSFGDEHINQSLLFPAVVNGKVKLFALCAQETEGMGGMKAASAFSAGFDGGGIRGGIAHPEGTDLWKFSNFVNLFK